MTTTTTTAAVTILVNVIGRNNETRESKSFNGRFDKSGARVDQPGRPALDIDLSVSTVAPQFPLIEFAAAQAANDLDTQKLLMLAHADRISAYEKSAAGGSVELRIAKAVLAYLVTNEGFLSEDGTGFVLKLDNLDVKTDVTSDGGTLYTVAGTAVFGANEYLDAFVAK